MSRGTTFVLLASVAALIFVGWAIAFAAVRGRLQPTTLCLNGDTELNGVLIGRTSDDFYVGEPDRRATLLGIKSTIVQANIAGGLRAAGIGINIVSNPDRVTYQRTSVVIADLDTGFDQLRAPRDAGIPILGYYHDANAVANNKDVAKRNGVAVVASEADVRRPQTLEDEMSAALQSRGGSELPPQRRIASVPSSRVEGYRLGAEGPCPVRA